MTGVATAPEAALKPSSILLPPWWPPRWLGAMEPSPDARLKPRNDAWCTRKAARRRPGGGGRPCRRLLYWSVGAGVWGLIFAVGLLGGVRHRPARHLQALRRQAPALDHLPRPLRRAGRRARQPVRAAGRHRRAAALRARRLRRHRGPAVLPPLRLRPVGHGCARRSTTCTASGADPCRAARPSPSSWPATCSSPRTRPIGARPRS